MKRALVTTVLPFCLMTFALGCTGRDPEPVVKERAVAPELPSLASVGGAQDIWPFDFGFDADRQTVSSAFGTPDVEESRFAGEGDARIITWGYPGVEFVFFSNPADVVEYLLSAGIKSREYQLSGGITIGMDIGSAEEILGEPGFVDEKRRVFFYYATTIELVLVGGIVDEVVLSRALP